MDFQKKDELDSKFVCPSDRQLALRAKLRTGWSSGKVNSPPLNSEEQAAILKVIRRNEVLEAIERQRVGRLVERLEKIKQRASGYGSNCCRLCGQSFSLLGASRLICDDCVRPVCSKCAVEICMRTQRTREKWLCKICSETREMWKKSNAWFFKGLPQYEITKIPITRNTLKENQTKPIPTKKLGIKVEDSSSDEDDTTDKLELQRNDSFKLKAMGSFKKFLYGESKFSKPISSNSQIDWDRISINSVTETNSNPKNSDLNELTHPNESGNQIKPICREPPLGWLEVLLIYSETDQRLDCSILRGRDLLPMNNAGLADPFCKVNIILEDGNPKQTEWQQTKTVHKTQNPEFNEVVKFCNVRPDDLNNSRLYIVILDDDKYGNDFLGVAKIKLLTIYKGSPYKICVPLECEDQYCTETSLTGPSFRGQILISLCYNTKKRSLIVMIKRCINLVSVGNNKSAHPFVKLQLKPGSKKFKTNIKWRNLNPHFNEEFYFETRPNDLNKEYLIITVWDKNFGRSNDFLGSIELGFNSKGKRLKQWTDCVRLPDFCHEQWHFLANDQTPH